MISFFRDFLSGPLYIVVVVISVIGIFACIGYLAERNLKEKEEKKKYEEMYAHVHLLPVDDTTGLQTVSTAQTAFPTAQLGNVGEVSATNVAQNVVFAQMESTSNSSSPTTSVAASAIAVEPSKVVPAVPQNVASNSVVSPVGKPEITSTTDASINSNQRQ